MRTMRTVRTLLLVCAAADSLSPARKVFLIRHAESEHNEAEKNWDLRGLLLKRDHAITTKGYAQCDALHEYVKAQRADAASPWADARLELYASPLTRAVQTALIATDGLDKPLVLLPDARELGAGPVAGRDSLGGAVGVLEVLDRVSGESARPLEIERIDAARCERRWWSRWEPHFRARRRVDRLLGDLVDGNDGPTAVGWSATTGGPAVVCCHSLLIRSILRHHCPDGGEFGGGQRHGLIPNCSVLSLDVGRDADGALRISNPALVFSPE